MARVLAVANQKGGVGKTTTAVNVASCLAEVGYKTLLVDLDPQGNATTGVGIDPRTLYSSMYQVLVGQKTIEETIIETPMQRLFVVPSNLDLAGAEIELVSVFSRELRLRNAIAMVQHSYDYVIIDCPPSLGILTINGLAAAEEVVIPVQCEYYALEGLGQLLNNVKLIQQNLNKDLFVSSIVLVMFDARTRLAEQVVNEVRGHFPDQVRETVIPRSVRLSEAPSYGQPVNQYDSLSKGAIAYKALANEIAKQTIGFKNNGKGIYQ
jgi:chromosome partitioning protein